MTRYGRKAEREGRVAAYLRFRAGCLDRHSGAMRSIEPGIVEIPGLVAAHRPGTTILFRVHPRLLRVGRFPHHALAALAAQQLDRIAVVDVAELSLVDAVAA